MNPCQKNRRHGLPSVAAGLLFSLSVHAQSQVQDVGLTLDFGPMLPAFVGYDCGPFTCQALSGGGFAGGATRTFTAYGAPTTPYVLALGLPGACQQVPGIANGLLLTDPIITLHVATLSGPVSGLPCGQGLDRFPLTMPTPVPSGLTVRFQSLGFGNGFVPAFGPAIDVTLP